MPIDDVWVTGAPIAGVPDQRRPPTDRHAVTIAEEVLRAPTEHLPSNADQGSNDTNMTPEKRDNGGVGGVRPAMPSFDPKAFDPGPDLPPLPTLRPLPKIRPLDRWSAGPEPAQHEQPTSPVEKHPVETVPLTEPVRHHHRAAEVTEPEPEPLAAGQGTARPRPAQRVLVLGGSGALGSAVARAMANQGARVAVHHATHAAEAGALVADLPGEGHLSIGADLSDSAGVADLIRSVDERFDGLDVVINAASAIESVSGASVMGSSLADWADAWTSALTVDVLGAAIVAHAAAAAFVARGRGGRIILLAGKGRPSTGVPNPVGLATEQAVGAFGSALASELAPHRIGVIVVGSGPAASPGWSPSALAETVAWLASGPTSSLPGAVFDIAG